MIWNACCNLVVSSLEFILFYYSLRSYFCLHLSQRKKARAATATIAILLKFSTHPCCCCHTHALPATFNFHTFICKRAVQTFKTLHHFVERRPREDKKPCHNTAGSDRKSSHLLPKSRLIFSQPEKEERGDGEGGTGVLRWKQRCECVLNQIKILKSRLMGNQISQ